jgi:hypothetical protein
MDEAQPEAQVIRLYSMAVAGSRKSGDDVSEARNW